MSKIAFLFPGQGAQIVGMGQQLAESLPAARQLYDRAAVVLGYDLAKICFEGPASALDSTVYSQPALFVTSLAALELLKSTSAPVVTACQATAGLSLGEYTALTFARAIEFEEALRVVQQRGQAMQAAADAEQSGMVSVLGLDSRQVELLCDEARIAGEVLQIANLLCPGNIVCSGHRNSCRQLIERAELAGAMKAIPLAVAGAFHTPIMRSAVAKLTEALQVAKLTKPQVTVVFNVDARSHDDPEEIRQLLIRQVVSPVLWEDSMRSLLALGCDEFYEVGPGKVLRGLLKRIDRKVPCHSVLSA